MEFVVCSSHHDFVRVSGGFCLPQAPGQAFAAGHLSLPDGRSMDAILLFRESDLPLIDDYLEVHNA